MLETTIVVLQHDNWRYTKRLIDSIEAYTRVKYHLVLVDNGSTDNEQSKTYAAHANLAGGHQVIMSPDNLGFAGGANLGIQEALNRESDYVCLINNDCQVNTPWLSKMIDALADRWSFKIGAISAMTTAQGQSIYVRRWIVKGQNQIVDISLSRLGMIPFTCVVFLTRVIEQVGMLDDQFFCYGEDDDYCHRLKLAGYKLCVHTGVTIKHEHGITARQVVKNISEQKAKARALLTQKWGDAWRE